MSDNIYWDAIEKYGEDLQFVIAMEECGELIQAISKVIRGKKFPRDPDGMESLAHEVADVQIMLNQLKEVISGHGVWDFDAIFELKLRRLKMKIGEK